MDTWEINLNIFMIAFAIVVFIGATVEVTMKKQKNINLILTFIYLLKLVLVTLYLLSTIDVLLLPYRNESSWIILRILVLFFYTFGSYQIFKHYKMWKKRDKK